MFEASIRVDLKRAVAGGALAAAVAAFGMWVTGTASGVTIDELLRDLVPNVQSFTGTVILACATILALMLTLLATSASSDSQLKAAHYVRIRQIAFGDTVVFVMAMTLDLLLNIPLSDSSQIGERAEWWSYHGTLGLASLLGGSLVAIVLMIYNTVTDMIEVLALHKDDHPISAAENADEKEAEEDNRDHAEEAAKQEEGEGEAGSSDEDATEKIDAQAEQEEETENEKAPAAA